MSTALVKLADNVGTTPEEIKSVLSGMIISAKAQHGAVATDAELTVVSGICAQYDLNPLTREAHAFVSGGKLSVVIGIDGWLKICNRQPDFNGLEYEYEFEDKELVSVTTKIHVKGRDYPTCVTEWMDECYQPTSPAWKKFKKRMLRNKSTGQAVRVAFGISEVIDDDEASRIRGNTPAERDITPRPSVNFTDIETAMSDCKTLDELKHACGKIREEMQTNGTWNNHKAEIIALNIKHKDRINSKKGEVTYDEETGEELAHEQAIIALNIKHKDRINSQKGEVTYDEETGEELAHEQAVKSTSKQTEPSEAEAIEGELLSAIDGATRGDGDDIGFGEDDGNDKDEFGE